MLVRLLYALLASLPLLALTAGGAGPVERGTLRFAQGEPSLAPDPRSVVPGGQYEWQYSATHMDRIPGWVLHAAASVPVAVIDTGADLSAPDLAVKQPAVFGVREAGDVGDANGHGTFVASIAAGSPDNNDGIAGFAGDAPLIVVKAGSEQGTFTAADEGQAIVEAVDRGARVVNLSLGGTRSSADERRAVAYAIAHGVLLVAAAGNEQLAGNPVEFPAALLQPPDSNGAGGAGLSVGGSTPEGSRAWFSNSGSWISLVAPSVSVFSAVARGSRYDSVPLPGARRGTYGYASGTSFAAPQVAGVAALVWAANPTLSAPQVADVIEQSASGQGSWNADTGFGVLDGSAAVEAATAALPHGLGVSWLTARFEGGELVARLLSRSAAALAGRRLLLERLAGEKWRREGSKTTDAHGRAAWRLDRGARYRVRFAGAPELTAASSPTAR